MKNEWVNWLPGVFLFFILVALVFLSLNPEKKFTSENMVDRPVVRSLLYNDRSYCEKVSEMVMLDAWEKRCTAAEKQDNCSLPESTAKSIFTHQSFVVQNCIDRLVKLQT